MRSSGPDERQRPEPDTPVNLYCLTAMLADEASLHGFRDFAQGLESLLAHFLSGLPRDQQADALRLSYEMALGGAEAAPPRLRLVYSRD